MQWRRIFKRPRFGCWKTIRREEVEAATFTDQQIDELRSRVDLVQLVSARVSLKKAGKDWKGTCPFHGDKTPSFYVSPEKRFWHCFGCGASGDAFKFLMQLEGKTFPEVVEQLARDNHLDLAPERPEDRKRREHLAALGEVTERACQFFQKVLEDPRRGQLGREHLEKRGMQAETIKLFRLGYAPNAWNELGDFLVKGGAQVSLAVEAGLLVPRKQAEGNYDRFRGRLTIPIHLDGRIVSFGGRLMEGESDAKYLNGPETPLYDKGRTLFGLAQARESIRREEMAVLVEGYFDAIALHQAGVHTAVASCGTSLTPAHLAALQKAGMKELAIVFDGDEAGLRATSRAAELCSGAGVAARVVLLPPGEDPDETVARVGHAGFRGLLDAGQSALDFLLDRALAKVGPSAGGARAASIEERVRAVEAVRPLVAAAPPGLARDMYVGKVAQKLGAPEQAVRAALFGSGARGAQAKDPGRQGPLSQVFEGGQRESSQAVAQEFVAPKAIPRVSAWTEQSSRAEWAALVSLVRDPTLASLFTAAVLDLYGSPAIAGWTRQALTAANDGVLNLASFAITVEDLAARERLVRDAEILAGEDAAVQVRSCLAKIAACHRRRRAQTEVERLSNLGEGEALEALARNRGR